ncbi:hypothetical protein [Vibrio ezurae]|uniref:Uncharacterized protein n=1 Tax=Vibrio ezurae NBRC 102218 TaxID=1219080 RepID=U3CEV9_9VIBR|nr:hypothetical protein [Vibrio ezurae]GAD79794.1 hypothetical protein VEZ01S_20_00660 [Vibrio ezurae NBRC 102218]
MKISKSVIAVAVSSVLLFGCDFDVSPESSAAGAGNGSTGGGVVVPDPGHSVANKLVQITDTSTTDTGELRLKLADGSTDAAVSSIAKGKLTVDLTYINDDPNQVDDGDGNNAYITLFGGDGTSNSNLVGEIAFNTNADSGDVYYRTDQGKPDLSSASVASFTPGEKLAVEMTWGDGEYTLTLNGTKVGTYPCSAEKGPVQVIALKMGDNSHTTPYKLLVDNFKVFNVTDAGDETVFTDDFEGHIVGQDLSANPYNSNSNEAVVIGEGDSDNGATDGGNTGGATGSLADDFESYTVGTLISKASTAWTTNNIVADATGTTTAEVSNVVANGGSQSLMLKDGSNTTKPFAIREFKAAAPSGSVSIDAYFSSANTKSTYINVGVGKANADRYFELKQTSNKLEYEAGDTDVKIADITPDTWYTVNLSWTQDGTFSVSLNGQVVKSGIKQSTTGLGAGNIPTQLTLYTGDNSSNVNTAYFDNLKSDLF